MFTNVMWATDGSEHADRALPYAVRIAKENGATLHAVHVIERLGGRFGGQPLRVNEPELEEQIRSQVADSDRAQHTKTILHIVPADARDVAGCIARVAEEADVDLIVVGTHGRSVVMGTVLGSVAQRLPHLAPCPVLAVSPNAASHDRGTLASTAGGVR